MRILGNIANYLQEAVREFSREHCSVLWDKEEPPWSPMNLFTDHFAPLRYGPKSSFLIAKVEESYGS